MFSAVSNRKVSFQSTITAVNKKKDRIPYWFCCWQLERFSLTWLKKKFVSRRTAFFSEVKCVSCLNMFIQIICIHINLNYTHTDVWLCRACMLSLNNHLSLSLSFSLRSPFRLIGYNLYTSIGHVYKPNNWSLIRVANCPYFSFLSSINRSISSVCMSPRKSSLSRRMTLNL